MDHSEIVDSHFHVYDLELRETFPNKNVSYVFPDKDSQAVIFKVKFNNILFSQDYLSISFLHFVDNYS